MTPASDPCFDHRMCNHRPSLFLLLALTLLLRGAPAAAQSPDGPAEGEAPASARPPGFYGELGAATLVFNGAGGRRVQQDGVALVWRSRTRVSPEVAGNVTVTWGLTDWDRAKEWIDAGNSAGEWTTEKIQSVTQWVEEGGDSQGLRTMGAFFADMFLIATYAAVPFCYVGSVAGATSHLQLDVTGSYHLDAGGLDLWAEGGLGVVGLPVKFVRWEYAAGPVVGVGFDTGPLRVGGRLLWAPDELTSSQRAERSVVTGSLTAGVKF
jgi:hypothetical protein